MLKVAVIGVGGMGTVHLNAWRKQEDVEVVALCDVRADMVKEKAEAARVYADIDELLASETIDIMDVCTPSYLHKEHVLKGLNKGVHVLCEKPGALFPEDFEEMAALAKQKGVKLMAAHVVRFMDEYRVLKHLFDTKKYGELLQGTFWRMSGTPTWSWKNWMLSEERSGWVPYDLHIHDCDYIYSLLGKPDAIKTTRVIMEKGTFSDHYIANYEYVGASITAEAAWFGCQSYAFRSGFEVTFEEAVVRSDGGNLKIYPIDGEAFDGMQAAKAESEETGINLGSTGGHYNEIVYFKECVKNDVAPDAVKANEIIDVLRILNEGIQNARVIRK